MLCGRAHGCWLSQPDPLVTFTLLSPQCVPCIIHIIKLRVDSGTSTHLERPQDDSEPCQSFPSITTRDLGEAPKPTKFQRPPLFCVLLLCCFATFVCSACVHYVQSPGTSLIVSYLLWAQTCLEHLFLRSSINAVVCYTLLGVHLAILSSSCTRAQATTGPSCDRTRSQGGQHQNFLFTSLQSTPNRTTNGN